MNSYPSYRDCDLYWIDKVPTHWSKTKNKHIFIEKDSTVGEHWENYPLLSLTKKGVILRDMESGKGKFPESFDNYKVVDTNDLIIALKTGQVRGAALDVTSPEPLPSDNQLYSFDNCIISPHIGTATIECRYEMARAAAKSILNNL